MFDETIVSYYIENPNEFNESLIPYFKILLSPESFNVLSKVSNVENTLLKQKYKDFKDTNGLDIGLYTEQVAEDLLPKLVLGKSSEQIKEIVSILNNSPLKNKVEENATFTEEKRIAHLQAINETLKLNPEESLLRFPERISDIHTLVPFLELPKFVTIAGDPGHGKSALLFQIAENFANQGHKVLFLDNELAKPDIFRRELSFYSGVSIDAQLKHIQNGETDTEINQLLEKAKNEILSKKGKLTFVSALGWDITMIKNYIIKNQNNYNIIILDQINRISGKGKLEERIASGVVDLKETTGKLGMLCLIAAQFTKQMQGQVDRDLSDLFGTVELANVSNVGMILESIKTANHYNTKSMFTKLMLDIVKCNSGKTGKIPIAFVGEKLTFFTKTYLEENTKYKNIL